MARLFVGKVAALALVGGLVWLMWETPAKAASAPPLPRPPTPPPPPQFVDDFLRSLGLEPPPDSHVPFHPILGPPVIITQSGFPIVRSATVGDRTFTVSILGVDPHGKKTYEVRLGDTWARGTRDASGKIELLDSGGDILELAGFEAAARQFPVEIWQ